MDEMHTQPWWPFLTYITQQQLDELIRRRDTYEHIKKLCLIIGLIGIIVVLIIFSTQLKRISIEYLIELLAIGLLLVLYGTIEYSKSFKEKFEKHKETMMKVVAGQFCIHGSKCDCKDNVARYLHDREHINLMF